MENHAKYGDSIYFHDETGLYVNLFIASELDWASRGLLLRQETRFPEEEGTTLKLRLEKPTELALRIRVPYWATRGVGVKINGQPQAVEARPVSYLSVDRTWKDGDRVEVSLPMDLHLDCLPDDPTLATVMYGPLVLAGKLGAEGLTDDMVYLKGQRDQSHGPGIAVPMLVVGDDDPGAWIEPVAGRRLAFRTVGVGRPDDVTLVPYHRLFGQRYSIYWRIVRDGSPQHREIVAEEAARRAKAARTVDSVAIGVPSSEKEHEFEGEKTQTGPHQGLFWRHASGWFSYRLSVLPDVPMTLSCTYWGSDSGNRTFDILVDGQKVAKQTLRRDRPNEFFDIEYELPLELTRGKEKVTVKFQAHAGNLAGGVFGCRMSRPTR